jgi:hypothetical protein
MDGVAKERLKEVLLAQARTDVRSSRGSVDREESASRLDQDSSFSVDDQSQAGEARDLGGLFEEVEERQQALVKRIGDLDFSPKDQVSPGAVVGFDGDRYVVGVVASAFSCDGATYEGISTDAPIYAAIEGLRAGDTFTFAGREHQIDFVA